MTYNTILPTGSFHPHSGATQPHILNHSPSDHDQLILYTIAISVTYIRTRTDVAAQTVIANWKELLAKEVNPDFPSLRNSKRFTLTKTRSNLKPAIPYLHSKQSGHSSAMQTIITILERNGRKRLGGGALLLLLHINGPRFTRQSLTETPTIGNRGHFAYKPECTAGC